MVAFVMLLAGFLLRRGADTGERRSIAPGKPTSLPSRSREYDRGAEAKVTSSEIDAYFRIRGRSVETLTLGYLLTRDAMYLKEALRMEPNDASALIVALAFDCHDTPEERDAQLRSLLAASPDNAIPHVLMALQLFRKGDSLAAFLELQKCTAAERHETYWAKYQALEEDFRRSIRGESLAESMANGRYYAPLDYGVVYNDLLIELRKFRFASEQAVGRSADSDRRFPLSEPAANEVTKLALFLAHLRGSSKGYDATLSAALGEQEFAEQLTDEAFVPMTGMTKGEFLRSVGNELASRKSLVVARNELLPKLTEAQAQAYRDARRQIGEVEALASLSTAH